MTTNELTTPTDRALATGNLLHQAGQAANRAAAKHVFADYRERKAANTIARQDRGLELFAQYLADVAGIPTGNLAHDPEAWRGVTWGLVEGFVEWQLQQGFAVGSVNVRLSTVKTYCKLAAKAGVLSPEEYAMIRTVSGYRLAEARHLDEKRVDAGLDTRRGHKKAEPVTINREIAGALKSDHADDPQGRRDRLMMCLLIDHGLRVGELVSLVVENFDLGTGFLGYLTFYREKVHKTQTIQLTTGTLQAARAYLQTNAAPAEGPLLLGSRRNGCLTSKPMSMRAIKKRVQALGERVGVEGLSPHDLRHYWATAAARAGTPIDRLQQAGGWSSLAMPARYIEEAEIANEGVVLE